MEFKELLNPSSTLGAFIISVCASFFVGFFTGKHVEKKKLTAKSKIKGDKNTVIQNSVLK